jgi:3-isopropylmalate/(R)-2-methylmalate dehydratase small subunit
MDAVRVITGRAVPLVRSDVDTDQIIPSDWLKRVERTGFGAGLFSEWRENSDFVLNQERYVGANILVAGANFGTGSSREHAVWALQDYGFEAVVSPRFADIFRNNSLKNGVLPIVVDPATHARLFAFLAADPDAEFTIDLAEQGVLLPDGTTLDFDIDPFAKRMILAGTDELGYLLLKEPEIDAWEARHPARIDSRVGAA